MERITAKIAALPEGASYFSLEFFPPKTQPGTANLLPRLQRLAHLRPLFVAVTWGAGGSTAKKSLELAETCQRQLGLTTCLHMTCTNMRRSVLDKALADAKSMGIQNILALRGDEPRAGEYDDLINGQQNGTKGLEEADEDVNFEYEIDLVRYIRRKHKKHFCIGVAAYPEGHSVTAYPTAQSPVHDLPHLINKVKAGADFIVTQLFYDVDAYLSFESLLRNHESGIFKDIPIIPGLMPIQSWQTLKRTTKLSCARVPRGIEEKLEACKGDDDAVKVVGVNALGEIINKINQSRIRTRRKKQGFHFYTLNLEKAVAQILERTNLVPPLPCLDEPVSDESEIAVHDNVSTSNGIKNPSTNLKGITLTEHRHRRSSAAANSTPHNRVVVPRPSPASPTLNGKPRPDLEALEDEAGIPNDKIHSGQTALAISEGKGSLGREATWDDFPNGRWGDARSPAYGSANAYTSTLPIPTPEAISLWSYPRSTADITSIFQCYLSGALPAIPWSEEGGLSAETRTIKDQLLKLNEKGWWTVASQPAVNGLDSADETFGWGPRMGFVWQKPFVEFFLPSADWTQLKKKLDDRREQTTYFAGNGLGDFVASDEGSVNPVTWGAFKGKEIITPTIIEAVSFRAWQDEAYRIWREWQRLYGNPLPDTDLITQDGNASAQEKTGQASRLLEKIRTDVWLVNVIGHEYVHGTELWEILLS